MFVFTDLPANSTRSQGPVDSPDRFSVFASVGVQIAHHEKQGAIACVQDSVYGPFFNTGNCFSESGFSMPKRAVSSANAICEVSAFDPWGPMEYLLTPLSQN